MSATRLGAAETYAAIHDGVVGRVAGRDVVRVSGPDALSYVQGQVSQDVASLVPGESAEALLLSVQGKLEAYVRVTLLGPEELLVDVEAGWGDVAFERLRRFKIRVKADLEQATWRLAELRGPASASALAAAGPSGGERHTVPIPVAWPGLVGVDLLGPSATLPAGVAEGDGTAFEAARIEAGQPRMGSELTDRTIAQEAGIVERTVSFTKGCYTGQELVARIDARGNRVPRLLRGLVFPASPPERLPGAGDTVAIDGREVGVVTSVAWSARTSSPVALGYLRREVVPPASGVLTSASGELEVAIEALPLVP
ncbi:MAG TPA: glycine cleavage T C-terminal barrel domain-containing protein [Acidimicrobiales bacterium]|nr:glycine cleavage T C-terminal barrel domain-containing protein [Acidimicrobiales bacterium]